MLRKLIVAICIAGSLTIGLKARETSDVSALLRKMTSPSWTVRRGAFEQSSRLFAAGNLAPDAADELREGIVNLLALENQRMPGANLNSEEHSEYYAELIDYVSRLNDERAIPALLGASCTGGMAIRGAARFGARALDPTLKEVLSGSSQRAHCAIYVLQKLLEVHTFKDRASLERIRDALGTSLHSPDHWVRQAAVWAVLFLDDREEFVPILKDIAEHDPYKRRGQAENGTASDGYPVRKLAASVLHDIAEHTPPPVDKGVAK